MFRKLLVALVALIVLAGVLVMYLYSSSKVATLDRLEDASLVIETRVGPIEYARSGKTGPLVLHLHGSPGRFAENPLPNVRTLSLSRPGYLRTPLATGRTVKDQAIVYAAFLDALGIDEKVFVYGISGGGPSAYEFTARYPDRVRGLIAVAAQSQSLPPDQIPGFLENDFIAWLSLQALSLSGPEAVAELVFSNPSDQIAVIESKTMQHEIVDFIWLVWPYSSLQAGYENDMKEFSDIALPLGDISVPTLIVHGTDDGDVPFEQAVYAREQIPAATLNVIEGADHLALFFTRRDEVMSAVRIFLESN